MTMARKANAFWGKRLQSYVTLTPAIQATLMELKAGEMSNNFGAL